MKKENPTTKKEDRKARAIAYLRECLGPGDKVYTNVTHVSQSGMSRHIRTYYVNPEHGIIDITGSVAAAVGWSQYNGWDLRVSGCGMDMCFHVVYVLGRVLFPDGFGVLGEDINGHKIRPCSKLSAAKAVVVGCKFFGRNGDKSGWDDDGGYALNKHDL